MSHVAREMLDKRLVSLSGDASTGRLSEPVSLGEASVVVSHIPRSVVVGNTLTSSISLSSDDCHTLRPLKSKIDDEAAEGSVHGATAIQEMRDSLGESSSRSVQSTGNKRKKIIVSSRKVSDCDLGANKKSRVEPPRQIYTTSPSLRILSRPEDAAVLNKLHLFVRQQIEVFTATAADMAQPAPGRKNPIRLHQVGLRCVHCRSLPSRDRVKRAVCYPSSVGRVYHSVSDMKFDHFSNCRGLSKDLHARFETLKAQCKRGSDRRTGGGSSSSTAQYYHDSALRMGMEDRRGGMFMVEQVAGSVPALTMSQISFARSLAAVNMVAHIEQDLRVLNPSRTMSAFSSIPLYRAPIVPFHQQINGLPFTHHQFETHKPAAGPVPHFTFPKIVKPCVEVLQPAVVTPRSNDANAGSIVLLSMEADPRYLNPLHCFVRRNVEVFVANEKDIAAPSPGRKTRVAMGQVGIRCIHCAKLPPKQRVKRAVCYPPSICGIYHSVSNMKFDHFGSCRGLPEAAREEFTQLRTNNNRRGGSTGNGSRGMSNSTAQYYHDSALRLGMVDTSSGMRFANGVLSRLQNKVAASDGISALMIAATNPIVRAEYNRRIEDDARHGSKVSC